MLPSFQPYESNSTLDLRKDATSTADDIQHGEAATDDHRNKLKDYRLI